MKKITLLFSLLFVLALASEMKAQDYKSAIGLRFGVPYGVSYKFFVSEPSAIDLYLGSRYSGLTFGATYQIHNDFPDVAGLKWFWGGGASVGFYTSDFQIGIAGVAGIEYTFADAPFNLSLDLMPTYYFDNYYQFEFNTAVSARYILNR